MDAKTLEVLEWGAVVAQLRARAVTAMGRSRCEALEIHTELEHVSHALRLTSEARVLLSRSPQFLSGHLPDVRTALRRVQQGAVLEGAELVALAELMHTAHQLKRALEEHRDELTALADLCEPIVPLPQLVAEIRRSIEPSGEVADRASHELAAVRQQARRLQAELRQLLQRLLVTTASHLQDAIVTVRADRYVLPVRAEAKHQVPGIVHDQSGSGATLFIEPMAAVDLNNRLREAQLAERDEARKVLVRLTDRAAEALPVLDGAVRAVAELDFCCAAARLADDLDGHAPRLDDEGETALVAARHPLLAERLGEGVVPVCLTLGQPHTVLLVTGPNTGGKTVSLKTLGLVTLMTQSGLHPPVAEGSRVAIYRQIFADIGDEQDLSRNLSTFSGHMTHLVRILDEVDGRTLVLLDELGAGTDPAEGAALARAIVEEIQRSGARLAATTHYGELKTLAWSMPGVANAAVEFDERTLRPTFRLLMGTPGRSNAISIAEGLGLSPGLARRAEQILEEGRSAAERLLAELEADRHAAAREREEARRSAEDADRVRRELECRLAELEARRTALVEAARAELAAELGQARAEIASVIRELQAAPVARSAQQAQERLHGAARRASDRLARHSPHDPSKARSRAQELVVGQRVYLPRLDQHGTVQTPPDAQGNLTLQIGIMRVSANASELGVPPGPRKPAGRTDLHDRLSASRPRSQAVSTRDAALQLDLRGMQTHEALQEVDRFLDTAYGHEVKQVTLIHGGGTGALRAAIRAHLRTSPYVADFRPGDRTEGGDGATVVTLS